MAYVDHAYDAPGHEDEFEGYGDYGDDQICEPDRRRTSTSGKFFEVRTRQRDALILQREMQLQALVEKTSTGSSRKLRAAYAKEIQQVEAELAAARGAPHVVGRSCEADARPVHGQRRRPGRADARVSDQDARQPRARAVRRAHRDGQRAPDQALIAQLEQKHRVLFSLPSLVDGARA